MARKQTNTENAPEPDVFDEQIARRQEEAATAGQTSPARAKWVDRFPQAVDEDAGVKLIQDRKNGLDSIAFREEPPRKAVAALESQGYQYDEEQDVYSKRVGKLRPGDSRDEARDLFHEVQNIVRQEKQLPPKASYYISRS